MKYTPRTKPFKHQAKATLRAARARNHAVFMEPRLGKTKVALDWVGILALRGEVRRVVVFAPRIALDVWEDQIHEHYPYSYHAETYEEEWEDTSRGGPSVSYFLAGREETFRAERVGRKLVRRKQEVVEAWRPDAIIVDESHEYKRPGGRGAQDAWRMVQRLRLHRQKAGKRGPFVLLLSGTPNPKGWRDLFAQFRIMDPALLGTSAAAFDEKYCVYGQGPRKYVIIRYRNLARLKRILREHSTVCTAAEAGLEGKLLFQTLRVDLPEKVRVKYVEMVEEFVTEVGGELVTAKNQGVKRLRLLQITGGRTTSGGRIHDEKVKKLTAWLEHLHGQEQNVLVYARHTAEVDACYAAAQAVGFVCGILDGRTKGKSRSDLLRRFARESRRPRCLCIQVQAGAVSIDLSWAAELVFYSLPDGWVSFWQSLNRVRGPNQKKPVRITAILARNTVDISALAALRNKEDMHRALMRSPSRFLLGEYHSEAP